MLILKSQDGLTLVTNPTTLSCRILDYPDKWVGIIETNNQITLWQTEISTKDYREKGNLKAVLSSILNDIYSVWGEENTIRKIDLSSYSY